uniref:Carboxypeptidase regulatory-like domain-containing protein n=1 Tax=candidate division WOR-3 bacterium TaxID=2052148 RepID=A0A7C2P124_UNCW3
MRYFYFGIALVAAFLLSSCSSITENTVTVKGKVGYVVAYIDTVLSETTYVFHPANGAKLYLMGDPGAEYPYSGEVLETTSDSIGEYTFVVEPITEYEGLIPSSNIGIKIQVFYFDSLIGPAYGELSGYTITPGKDVTLPTIYLNRKTQ